MEDEEKHNAFIDNVPILNLTQLTKRGKQFLQGIKKTSRGKKELRNAARNFIWFNLGGVESGNDPKIQTLRRRAFSEFGKKMRDTYPNCFFWKGKPDMGGKRGKKPSYSKLLKDIGKICTARKRQGYRCESGERLWRANRWEGLLKEFDIATAMNQLGEDLESDASSGNLVIAE